MVTDHLFNWGLTFNSVVCCSQNSLQTPPPTHAQARAHTRPFWKLGKILFRVLKITDTDPICKLFECPLMSSLSLETKASLKRHSLPLLYSWASASFPNSAHFIFLYLEVHPHLQQTFAESGVILVIFLPSSLKSEHTPSLFFLYWI